MQITVQLPDDIARLLGTAAELPRKLLEAYAAEGYRTEKLSRHQVGQILGMDRWQTESFLAEHEAQRPYSLADWNLDRKSLDGLTVK